MSLVTVGFLPQTGQLGSRGILYSRKLMSIASYRSNRPISSLPLPRMSLTASLAWMLPMVAQMTPSTPPSAQLGTSPGGGGLGEQNKEQQTPPHKARHTRRSALAPTT